MNLYRKLTCARRPSLRSTLSRLPCAHLSDLGPVHTWLTYSSQTAITTTDSTSAPGRLAKRDTGDFATLKVPMQPSKTDVVARSLLLTFQNVPFTSIDNMIFSSFLMETTVGSTKGFALHGAADSSSCQLKSAGSLPEFELLKRSPQRPSETFTSRASPSRFKRRFRVFRDSTRNPRPSATLTSSMDSRLTFR